MARRRREASVNGIARRISKNLMSAGEDFLSLARAIHSGISAKTAAATRGRGAAGRVPRRRRRARRALTAADRARLRVQGEYLGLVRHLSVRNRARVKRVRSKRGYTPAIRMARRLARSRG